MGQAETPSRNICLSPASSRLMRTCKLWDDVDTIRFVTAARRKVLDKMGIRTVRDLFLHAPFRYLDFSRTTTIAAADLGSQVTVVVKVDKVQVKHPKPKLSVCQVFVVDGTGIMQLVFFRQPWIAGQFHPGDLLAVSGKVDFKYGFKQMQAPFFEVLQKASEEGEGSQPSFLPDLSPRPRPQSGRPLPPGVAVARQVARILPVHGAAEGLSPAWMRRIVSQAIETNGDVFDYLPADMLGDIPLMGRSQAIRSMHFPATVHESQLARKRYAFDELFLLQIALNSRRYLLEENLQPHRCPGPGRSFDRLIQALPFRLTAEQEAALTQISDDMCADKVMNRLLLGDVGTGKTVVAALACALAKDAGYQVAFMAPTTVLAQQHYRKLQPLFAQAQISCELLLGSTEAGRRREIDEGLSDGSLDVVIGTVALLSDDVAFHDLGLVIIDEQHRFGVGQRSRLRQKGAAPDLLSMTATPIPRTLALTLYGDMDISTIAHKPFQTAATTTKVLALENLIQAYQAINAALEAGHQAYVVCSVIDEADEGEDLFGEASFDEMGETRRLYPVIGEAKQLERLFPEARIGVLYGRMSDEEKTATMNLFAQGDLDILVSTTVVEVGVDVPNAQVLVVLDADRFGLSTLHQLRGRVGRGTVPGQVFLVSPARKGTPSRKRLQALEACADGFRLAEEDLELRHEGEILGYRQHGGVSLRFTDLMEDGPLIEQARNSARQLCREDPELASDEHKPIAMEARARFGGYFEEVVKA